ncbi:hypothetical protein M9978_08290 [Sphingomonas sp. MG17]|uniref:Uncharacterized protein n=1 Tax=Sphingomonas tagetis TaxID=2949092 RepID=A0A9X2HG03_9SPHN|nr:hypothetical protein [Sphingomonas tagetis]MCP3730426.1 hypothetical protein [Sphingomonas tagetis]
MTEAFADACGERVMGGASAEQLDMMRDLEGRLPTDTFRRMRIEQRGRGRPKGARNRENTDLAKLICQEGGDPQLFLARVYSTPLDILCEQLLIAEGAPQREDRLIEMCDALTDMLKLAGREQWGKDQMQVLVQVADRVERAASSMKSKPGDIAMKALALQVTAAKEVSPYVHKKKPVDVAVQHTRNVIFMPAPQAAVADPVDAVMRRTVEAMNSGEVTAAQILDMRFDSDSGAFVERADDAQDGE